MTSGVVITGGDTASGEAWTPNAAVMIEVGRSRSGGGDETGTKIWDQVLKMSCRKKKSCLMGHYQQIINLCHRVWNRLNTYVSGV